MKKTICLATLSLILVWPHPGAESQDSWSPEQLEVLAAMSRLSAATAPDGKGADEYGSVLADDFSRWTTGSKVINHKKEWVEGVRDWFEDGWRVADRNQTILEITIRGDEAYVRRIVEETYLGPDGERTTSAAGLAETWIGADGGWLLFRADVDVLDTQ